MHSQDLPVLVTGGAGFIGSHLVDTLIARGDRVRVLDNFTTGRRENLAAVAGAIELIEGDVRDWETIRRAAAGCDLIFHLAALVSVPRSIQEPALNHEINVTGTFHVLEAARQAGIRRVVYASSAAVYGDNQNLPLNESEPPAPLAPYGAAKLINEQTAAVYNRTYGLEAIGLRYFNVIGPRQDPASPYSGVLTIFCERLLAGRPLAIHGDGRQSRDFVDVADVVQANLLAAGLPAERAAERLFNVASGVQTDLRALVRLLADHLEREPVIETGPPRDGDIRHSRADIGRARAVLGFEPRVAIADSISRILASQPGEPFP